MRKLLIISLAFIGCFLTGFYNSIMDDFIVIGGKKVFTYGFPFRYYSSNIGVQYQDELWIIILKWIINFLIFYLVSRMIVNGFLCTNKNRKNETGING